jgi:metal-responsive CopG/Arc/MetJ family transcriptional regulator
MADKNVKKGGYTSVTLGDSLLSKVDEHASETALNNRSLTIRLILEQYYKLKVDGIDILKMDIKEMIER